MYTTQGLYKNVHLFTELHSPIRTRLLRDREVLAYRKPQSCAAHAVPITRSATPPRLIASMTPSAHRATASSTWLQLLYCVKW